MVTTTERIQLNRKTAAQWTAQNPTLLAGEAGVELDTGRAKFGNGTTAWTALPYSTGATGGGGTTVTTVAGRSGDVTLTPADVQLGNVQNLAPANLPVSTAQATALAAKADYPTGGVNGQALVKSGTSTAWATISGTAASPATQSISGTTYSLSLTDAGNIVEQSSTNVLTVTVPTNATVAFPIGTVIEFVLYGGSPGTLVISPASGVTVLSPNNARRLTTQYATAAIRKRSTNEWIMSGYTVV